MTSTGSENHTALIGVVDQGRWLLSMSRVGGRLTVAFAHCAINPQYYLRVFTMRGAAIDAVTSCR
jgi:hypothetical protein